MRVITPHSVPSGVYVILSSALCRVTVGTYRQNILYVRMRVQNKENITALLFYLILFTGRLTQKVSTVT